MELNYPLKNVVEVIDNEPVLNSELLELGKLAEKAKLLR